MKDKTKNTTAFSLFGPATATSANGDNGKSNSKTTSVVNITVDVAGLIAKGKALLEDESLDTSSGKLKFFRALGKELLKNHPELAKQFEQATSLSYFSKNPFSLNSESEIKEHKERSRKCAIDAVQRGIEFLEML
jgi:hypothetical protein